jgi:hypothetical protein
MDNGDAADDDLVNATLATWKRIVAVKTNMNDNYSFLAAAILTAAEHVARHTAEPKPAKRAAKAAKAETSATRRNSR